MGSKLSVAPTIKAHYATFRHDVTGEIHLPDYAIFVGAPAFFGILAWVCDVRLTEVAGFLGGLAVFAALLFALVIFVFQLRMQLREVDQYAGRRTLVKLVDQLFANVCYAVVVGLTTTAIGVAAANMTNGGQGAPPWLSALLIAFGLHLILTIFMCLKRVHSAYRQLAR